MNRTLCLLLFVLCCIIINSISIKAIEKERVCEYKLHFEDAYTESDNALIKNEYNKSDIIVTLQLEENFKCKHKKINNYKQVLEHREELKYYFSHYNKQTLKNLKLKNYETVSISEYAPFIQLRYPNINHFNRENYIQKKLNFDDEVFKIYVKNHIEIYDEAYRNGENYNQTYNFENALSDVGIPSLKPFTGNNIKVGMIESGIPNSLVNLAGKTLETYGTNLTEHCFLTTSVLGGTSGIANDVDFYCASLTNYSFYECANWLINQGVQIINRSNGAATGMYTSDSAFADYLVNEAKVTFVNSAGNSGNTNIIAVPSTGANVISVASTDCNKAISSFSSAGLGSQLDSLLAKPTISAPGGNLANISNINESISGTSFSAPIVSAIIAMLMEEFPFLQAHPEIVMSLITSSATPVSGQSNWWDYDSGTGMINYNNARNRYNNYYAYETLGNSESGAMIASHTITVAPNSELKILNFNMYNANINSNANLQYSLYTLRLEIGTLGLQATSIRKANFNFLRYVNSTASPVSITVKIYLNGDKINSNAEFGAFVFYVSPHICSYIHRYMRYSSGLHKSFCECGNYTLSPHVIYATTNRYANCLSCGYLLDLTVDFAIVIN